MKVAVSIVLPTVFGLIYLVYALFVDLETPIIGTWDLALFELKLFIVLI